MLTTIKFNPLLQAALGGCLLVFGTSHAYASPMLRLDNFHPNCDVRPLNLSHAQINELRSIRKEYKKAIEKASRKEERVSKNRRRDIIKILSSDKFNADDSRDYIESRYLASMDFAVDELAIQHRFYKLLTPLQRQHWLNTCLR
ncbi:Spy/CpxP family protein refolding chaperone [Neisseria musculi]|uniref:LTXXQ motif family protein n=1 Tax=Neisseria musculi TaxID=1815583 RepID=A0A7H1MCM7_9NEIS|nr:hypothetical protein [Neisseria musculi]QNT59392.1 hypothetical protein H7A79_1235 [Neisseria musculi]